MRPHFGLLRQDRAARPERVGQQAVRRPLGRNRPGADAEHSHPVFFLPVKCSMRRLLGWPKCRPGGGWRHRYRGPEGDKTGPRPGRPRRPSSNRPHDESGGQRLAVGAATWPQMNSTVSNGNLRDQAMGRRRRRRRRPGSAILKPHFRGPIQTPAPSPGDDDFQPSGCSLSERSVATPTAVSENRR